MRFASVQGRKLKGAAVFGRNKVQSCSTWLCRLIMGSMFLLEGINKLHQVLLDDLEFLEPDLLLLDDPTFQNIELSVIQSLGLDQTLAPVLVFHVDVFKVGLVFDHLLIILLKEGRASNLYAFEHNFIFP